MRGCKVSSVQLQPFIGFILCSAQSRGSKLHWLIDMTFPGVAEEHVNEALRKVHV